MSAAPTTMEWIRTAVRRIGDGSVILAVRIARLGAKSGRARAAGIRGWLGESSGLVDTALRWGLLYAAARVLLHVAPGPLHLLLSTWQSIPSAMWWTCVVWAVLAYRASGKPKEQPEGKTGEDDHPGPDEVLRVLHQLMADGRGLHVAAVRDHLARAFPSREWSQADVRQVLADAGIRVRHSVKVRGVGVAVGVHRDDLPPLPSPATEEAGSGVAPQVTAATATATPAVEDIGGGAGFIVKPADDRRQEVA
ncbi:hypothetical protein PV350_04820 [Streptomyces sp. PA03-6a]|nr:hypothetical protein [Streptomyces sp. PA03-6a]